MESQDIRDGLGRSKKRIRQRRFDDFHFRFVGHIDEYAGQLVSRIELRSARSAQSDACAHQRGRGRLSEKRYSPCNMSTLDTKIQIKAMALLPYTVDDPFHLDPLTVVLCRGHLVEGNKSR